LMSPQRSQIRLKTHPQNRRNLNVAKKNTAAVGEDTAEIENLAAIKIFSPAVMRSNSRSLKTPENPSRMKRGKIAVNISDVIIITVKDRMIITARRISNREAPEVNENGQRLFRGD
ncbi:MAG TPA: hypothetical protein PKK48_04695, partial [Phycisphaerae bacterium]|nr:hypothetical protein [Phycisphaerae bacterium]